MPRSSAHWRSRSRVRTAQLAKCSARVGYVSPRTAKSTTPRQTAVATTADTPTRRTQQERSSQAERALLDAAASLFARRGVDQTSLADIGELAGYSRGLANHHFGTKASLIEQLAKRTQTDFVADVGDDFGDVVAALVEMADNYLATVKRDADTTRAFFVMWGAAIPSEATMRPVFATDDAQFRSGVESLLRLGQENKSVTADLDPKSAAAMLVGMLRGVSAQYLIDPKAFNMSAARRTCEQFIHRNFAPPAKRSRTK